MSPSCSVPGHSPWDSKQQALIGQHSHQQQGQRGHKMAFQLQNFTHLHDSSLIYLMVSFDEGIREEDITNKMGFFKNIFT